MPSEFHDLRCDGLNHLAIGYDMARHSPPSRSSIPFNDRGLDARMRPQNLIPNFGRCKVFHMRIVKSAAENTQK